MSRPFKKIYRRLGDDVDLDDIERSRHLDELNYFFWKGRMFPNDVSVASSQQSGLQFSE